MQYLETNNHLVHVVKYRRKAIDDTVERRRKKLLLKYDFLTKSQSEKLYPERSVRTNTMIPSHYSWKGTYYGLLGNGRKVKVTKRKPAEQTEHV